MTEPVHTISSQMHFGAIPVEVRIMSLGDSQDVLPLTGITQKNVIPLVSLVILDFILLEFYGGGGSVRQSFT